jgi:hypothetical protein
LSIRTPSSSWSSRVVNAFRVPDLIFCQVPRSSALLLVALPHADPVDGRSARRSSTPSFSFKAGQAFGSAASGQLA